MSTSENVDDVPTSQDWDRFYMVFGGHIHFQTLRTAAKLDLFTLIDQDPGLTRAQIAQRLAVQEQPMRIVLLGLVATGILDKKGDGYYNTPLASRLLVKGKRGSILAYIELEHHVMYKAMSAMLESVQQYRNVGLREFKGDEPTIYQRLAHYPELEQVFQNAMQELSVHANEQLAEIEDFSSVQHVVDVGGGDGTNLIQLAERWPHLRGTVFDWPTVCEIASNNIQLHGLKDRINAVPGDSFNDPLPTEGDCFLFCHFFTIWSQDKDRRLLQKAYDALPSGGKAIVFNMMQHDDETGPLTAAVGSPYFLTIATGEGMLYTWSEYESWMKESGFKTIEKRRLQRDHGAIIGTK